MATVTYFVKGKRNPSPIYVRFSASRDVFYRRSTSIQIDPKYFNNKNGKVRAVAEFKQRDEVTSKLNKLRTFLIDEYNKSNSEGTIFPNGWMDEKLDQFFNRAKNKNLNRLVEYCNYYIERLPYKSNSNGKNGATKPTISKYITIRNKINEFEAYTKKKYLLVDVNESFRDKFLDYLHKVDKLSLNTAGRYIKFLKTVCLDAKKRGFKVSDQLDYVKGFTVKADKIVLNKEELTQIAATEFNKQEMIDARDWLIIGAYIGQRVGDLLSLTESNIKRNGKRKFIELIQQKTKKNVSILMHPRVEEVLTKRGDQFPMSYGNNLESSKTIFNRYIKKVCQVAGLTQQIEGSKMNPETGRKESGIFEKWELVTSHICRRSFATNHYGDIPTALLINITGHSTEREFLNYIGKAPIDYAEQLAKYWSVEEQLEKQEGQFEVVAKSANQ